MDATDSRSISPDSFGPLAGDHADDDGQAIDDAFLAGPVGPIDYGAFLQEPELDSLTKPTRILSRQVVFLPGSEPVLLYPADIARVGLQIQWAGDADSTVRFASDKSESLFAAPLYQAAGGGGIFTFDAHTGPVWIHAVVNTGQTNVGVTVVTS